HDVIAPGDVFHATLSIDASRVGSAVVDGYIAAILPNGRVEFLFQKANWPVSNLNALPVNFGHVPNWPTGPVKLVATLVEPGTGVQDVAAWIASNGQNNAWHALDVGHLILVDTPWRPSGPHFSLSNVHYPQVFAHAGGTIDRQEYTNSL